MQHLKLAKIFLFVCLLTFFHVSISSELTPNYYDVPELNLVSVYLTQLEEAYQDKDLSTMEEILEILAQKIEKVTKIAESATLNEEETAIINKQIESVGFYKEILEKNLLEPDKTDTSSKESLLGFTVDIYPGDQNIFGAQYDSEPDFGKEFNLRNRSNVRYTDGTFNSILYQIDNEFKLANIPLNVNIAGLHSIATPADSYNRIQLQNSGKATLPIVENADYNLDLLLQNSSAASNKYLQLYFDVNKKYEKDLLNLNYSNYLPNESQYLYHKLSGRYSDYEDGELFGYKKNTDTMVYTMFYPSNATNNMVYLAYRNNMEKDTDSWQSRLVANNFFINTAASYYATYQTYRHDYGDIVCNLDYKYYPNSTSDYYRLNVNKQVFRQGSNTSELEFGYYGFTLNSNSYYNVGLRSRIKDYGENVLITNLDLQAHRKLFVEGVKSINIIKINASGDLSLFKNIESRYYSYIELDRYDNPSSSYNDFNSYSIDLNNRYDLGNGIDAKFDIKIYIRDYLGASMSDETSVSFVLYTGLKI